MDDKDYKEKMDELQKEFDRGQKVLKISLILFVVLVVLYVVLDIIIALQ